MSVWQCLQSLFFGLRRHSASLLAILMTVSLVSLTDAQESREKRPSATDPYGPAEQQKTDQEAAERAQQLRAYQENLELLRQQQNKLEKALAELYQAREQTLPGHLRAAFQNDAERARAQAQLEAAKRQMEIALQQKMVAVHHDAVPRAYMLKYIKAREAAEVLQKIYADAPMRIAFDEPGNLLLVLSDEKTFESVADLIKHLDQPATGPGAKRKPETLQLRIIWIGNAQASEEKSDVAAFFGPNVGDALRELGFDVPRLLHQAMVSTVVGPNNPGEFDFDVPVGTSLRLTGGGNVHMSDEERYKVYFELGAIQLIGDQAGQHQVDGSVSMPLDHYMIVGTSALVPSQAQDGSAAQQPCALIIQLKRAPQFQAATTASGEKKVN